jgi:hypothetical protein
MNELAQLNAKVDMLLSIVTDLRATVRQAIGQQEKPMTIVGFGRRVGLSRWAIKDRIRKGQILTKGGKIPPSELKKFGLLP